MSDVNVVIINSRCIALFLAAVGQVNLKNFSAFSHSTRRHHPVSVNARWSDLDDVKFERGDVSTIQHLRTEQVNDRESRVKTQTIKQMRPYAASEQVTKQLAYRRTAPFLQGLIARPRGPHPFLLPAPPHQKLVCFLRLLGIVDGFGRFTPRLTMEQKRSCGYFLCLRKARRNGRRQAKVVQLTAFNSRLRGHHGQIVQAVISSLYIHTII